MADACDIGNVMKKYEATGLLTHVNTHQGQYGNFIGYEDYHASLNQIISAQAAFNSIPANIRARFNNDAATFLEFVQDPANGEELIKLGLATPRASEAPPAESGTTPPLPDPTATPAARQPGSIGDRRKHRDHEASIYRRRHTDSDR